MSAIDPNTSAGLADLNEPQRQAVTHRDGPLLVLAGPGSGKTRVITRRAAHLVQTGVPAHNILAITFTNKAAEEMKKRIEAMGIGRGMWVHTFHALGARLIREFGPLARVSPGFTIYDEADRLRVVKEAMALASVSDTLVRPEAVQQAISRAKDKLQTPAVYGDAANFFDRQAIARAYETYEQLLEQRNAVDFDDLLMRVALVLREHADIVERLNVRFRYVLIDEYQDTNHAQYLIARHLAEHHHNICATGDPDQSIYGWRGADIGNILEFERDYPNAVVVRLEQNYRSTGRILQAASSLIAGNKRRKHKKLWTSGPDGEPVQVWRFAEGEAEADRIGETIARLRREGRPYSDFAIFYRVNALSRGLEDALRRRAIPYRIARGLEFYNRKEIRDTLAYLRVLVNPADQVALLRIINTPTRGIGKTTVERLVDAARHDERPLLDVLRDAERMPELKTGAKKVRAFVDLMDRIKKEAAELVAGAVETVLALSGLEAALRKEQDEDGGEDRLANVQELVTAAATYEGDVEEPTLEDFLQRVALVSDQDAVDETAGVVMLMTLHAAKGLEFPHVFMVGLEQGLLPHENALREGIEVEEERRLCFVGITRARQQLVMSHAAVRVIRGVPTPRAPSQFLVELDPATTHVQNFAPMTWKRSGPRSSRRDEDAQPDADGFVPLHDHLPPEESRRRRAHGQRSRPASNERIEDVRIIDAAAAAAPQSAYAGWKPEMLVRHAKYGVGQIVWIRPGAGQTRAAIRFAHGGEKTFILELAPIEALRR
ncbi:MAG: UvrD-helicase domain-containing protein [Phycisphaerae bacterium]|jgi:DNA helicase-2/ATP-dependent DNA helicase PcrA